MFDGEQLELRDALRALLDTQCTPGDVREAWESETGRSPQRWRALADMGVVGTTIPEPLGGMGLDETWLVLLLEEAGRAALPEPLGPVTVAAALLAEAVPDLAEQWLPRVAAGDAIAVAAVPGRPLVDDAHVADLILWAADDEVHVVTESQRVAQPSFARSHRRFTLAAPRDDTTCAASGAAAAVAAAGDRALLAEAAFVLGTARRLIEMGTRYALEREQFGVPIGSFQAVKHQLASAAVRTEFAAPAVYRAAWSVANHAQGRREHVAMARTLAGQAAHLAARTALQVHGAIGYTDEHDLHLWLRHGLDPSAGLP